MLVGGKLSGALRIAWGGSFFEVGRNPYRLVESTVLTMKASMNVLAE
jgi:hypothetical protein